MGHGQGVAGTVGGGDDVRLGHGFLSLREHLEDIVISNVLMGGLLALGLWSYRRRRQRREAARGEAAEDGAAFHMRHRHAPLTPLEKSIVALLALCVFLNLFYKAGLGEKPVPAHARHPGRPTAKRVVLTRELVFLSPGWVNLALMLFPCHVLSLCFIYILCTSNTDRATYLFNFIVFYSHYTYAPAFCLVACSDRDILWIVPRAVAALWPWIGRLPCCFLTSRTSSFSCSTRCSGSTTPVPRATSAQARINKLTCVNVPPHSALADSLPAGVERAL